MATAPAPRSELPGLDTSPDVYETLVDDETTASTAGNRSSPPLPSESSDTSADEDDEDEGGGVSRRRLHVSGARLRFGEQSRVYQTKGADLRDRVDGRRKGWTVKRGGVTRDEDESLEAKIARLRREVEECRAEAEAERQQKREEEEGGGKDAGQDGEGYVDATEKLCEMLAEAQLPEKARRKRGHGRNQSESVFHDAPTTAIPDTGDAEGTDEQTLAKVSAFDQRLAALEAALGIASLDSVTDVDATTTPLLPTLTLLDQQLASLTTAASLSSLEQATSRIQKLKTEAQNLTQLQRAAVSAKSTPAGSDDDEEETETPALLSSDDMKRLETLYTLLPSLQSLSPTFPPLITRLRSLRTLHAAAANAGQDLDDIESRQAEMDKELKMWREGLQKVEEAVQQHGEANGRNGNFVKGWVQELERRVKALGR
ncbi:putative dynamitin [Septoria linicola]|nr:putative dynamitin [Septoria linicola]